MNRRGFLRGLVTSAMAGALSSAARWLPMPAAPALSELPTPTLAECRGTLLDWARTLDPSGHVSALVRMLNEDNEILHGMVFEEAPPGPHRMTIRTQMPSVGWRQP